MDLVFPTWARSGAAVPWSVGGAEVLGVEPAVPLGDTGVNRDTKVSSGYGASVSRGSI